MQSQYGHHDTTSRRDHDESTSTWRVDDSTTRQRVNVCMKSQTPSPQRVHVHIQLPVASKFEQIICLFMIVPVPLLIEGANNLSKTFVKHKKTRIRYSFFFLFLFRKPVKTRTHVLRVWVLRGYRLSYPDPYPSDPYPWPPRVSKPVVFPNPTRVMIWSTIAGSPVI